MEQGPAHRLDDEAEPALHGAAVPQAEQRRPHVQRQHHDEAAEANPHRDPLARIPTVDDPRHVAREIFHGDEHDVADREADHRGHREKVDAPRALAAAEQS